MIKYALILKTYSRTIGGKANRLCGIVKIKEGDVVIQKVEDKSTLTELSAALRKKPFIPINLAIPKKGTVEFCYLSNETLKTIRKERTVPASNFMGTIAANVDSRKLSDKAFRDFIRNSLPVVIYDGCEKD